MLFHKFNSEYINRNAGNVTLYYPNDSFYFVAIVFYFFCIALMIIALSSTSSLFIPFMIVTIMLSATFIMFLYLLFIGKTWFHVIFTGIDSLFINTEIIRSKYSTRLSGNTKQRFSTVDEDEIGDVTDEIKPKQDKVFRIDMNKLNGALSRRGGLFK
tara:strand:+ start:14282 stop:14752 length:471 start_codon:yes stop_codon:yes gene_type:complete